MNPRRVRIYIAGPLTQGDIRWNVAQAIEVGNQLIEAGLAPYIPHLNYFQEQFYHQPYETWLELDLEWLSACHALLRLDGPSDGADKEVAASHRMGIPVWHTVEEVVERYGRKEGLA